MNFYLTCPNACGTEPVRDDRWDAFYCPKCDVWTEPVCLCPLCDQKRPERPSEAREGTP